MDAENGVISPGGVGYDINCGVRLAIVPVRFRAHRKNKKQALLPKSLSWSLPALGKGTKEKRSKRARLQEASHSRRQVVGRAGLRISQDLEHMESNGKIEGADMHAISSSAIARGKTNSAPSAPEPLCRDRRRRKIFLPEIAPAWDIEEGRTYVLIHSGSRGFGHQVCQDTLDAFIHEGFRRRASRRQLVAAPI